MLVARALGTDPVVPPDAPQDRAVTEQELHPARHPLLGEEVLRARRRVVRRVHGHREDGHVAAQVVERAADRLRLHGARVLAGRVHEGEHDRAAAVVPRARRRFRPGRGAGSPWAGWEGGWIRPTPV